MNLILGNDTFWYRTTIVKYPISDKKVSPKEKYLMYPVITPHKHKKRKANDEDMNSKLCVLIFLTIPKIINANVEKVPIYTKIGSLIGISDTLFL